MLWIIGRRWNMDSAQADYHWDRTQARLLDLGIATQWQGRDLDWAIVSMRTSSWGAEAVVVAGRDHVGA